MNDPRPRDAVDEELEFHLARRAEEHERHGLSPKEARRRALRAFGDLEGTRRYCRRHSRRSWRRRRRRQMFEHSVQDVKFALRQMQRSPTTVAVIVATLALGIGANTAIFSLVQATLLQATPVEDPGTLVALWTTCRRGDPRCSSSYPDIVDYRERSSTLTDLGAYTMERASLGDDAGSRVVTVQLSTGNLFPLLGVVPRLGRLLSPSDDVPGGAAVAVLSYDLWRDHFAANNTVVGRTVRLNGNPFEVIGVGPQSFRGITVGDGPDIYIPLLVGPSMASGFVVDDSRFSRRNSRWIGQLVGRMAPDSTLEQVRSEMSAISDQLAAEDPDARGPRRITVDHAHRLILPIASEASFSRFLLLLLVVVGLTLLLACANLANLQLARAANRRQELAIRAAIGAGRGRLIRQTLTESLVLSMLGGIAGLALGPFLLVALAGYQLPGRIDIAGLQAGLNVPVLLFTFALAVTTGMLFGIGPAVSSGRSNSMQALAAGVRTTTLRSAWVRGGLVAVQVGVSLVLLVGATLFLRALQAGLNVDLGFLGDNDLVLTTIDLSLLQYGAGDAEALLQEIEQRMITTPGVVSFAAATRVPLMTGGTATMLDSVVDYQPAADEELRLEYNVVTPDFFTALGLPLVAGRVFEQGDLVEGAPVALVINQDMADRWWPGRSAVGGTMRFFGGEQSARVVGIATNTKWDDGMLTDDYPFAYMPMTGSRAADRPITLLVRTQRAETTMATLRQQLLELDSDMPILQASTFDSLRQTVLMPQRMGAALLGVFALLALLLSAVGIYGVVGHSVSQRTREIGIRMALGADRHRIVGMVARGVFVPVVAGVAAGLGGALLLSGAVRSFLYGVSPADPMSFVLVVAVLASITALAAWLPARRAARVDPVRALNLD